MVINKSLIPWLLALCSCTAGLIDIELPDNGQVIVVNGFIRDGRSELTLMLSTEADDTIDLIAPNYLDGADILLEDNTGKTFTFRPSGRGRYLLDTALSNRQHYTVVAKWNSLTARVDNIELPPPLPSVDVSGGHATTNEDEEYCFTQKCISFDLSYRLGPGTAPHLLIQSDIPVTDSVDAPRLYSRFSEEIIASCQITQSNYLSWPTECFAGEELVRFPFFVGLDSRLLQTDMDPAYFPDSVYLAVSTVQPILTEHLRSLQNTDNPFEQIFVVPNLYVSNVTGGLGIVSGASTTYYAFAVER